MGQSCAYQNSIRDLVITAVDVGLYASKWTNANNYNNLQFISNGAASYWFDHVDESTVFGGFTVPPSPTHTPLVPKLAQRGVSTS